MTSSVLQLFVYPIKSLRGIACDELLITDRGPANDRRWMLVDEHGRFITQREVPRLCLFDLSLFDNGIRVQSGANDGSITIPFTLTSGVSRNVSVWSDTLDAIECTNEVNQFFSQEINRDCRLVYMPDATERLSDIRYSGTRALTSLADAFPLLLVGSQSLELLNQRLIETNEPALSWDRFRPNVVVHTSDPHEEDAWAEFRMGNVEARGVKLCSRCVMTTIDQSSALGSKEPLRALATYRNIGGKIMFGQHVIAEKGIVRVGDSVEVDLIGLPLNARS
jgi:uncharacterized protein